MRLLNPTAAGRIQDLSRKSRERSNSPSSSVPSPKLRERFCSNNSRSSFGKDGGKDGNQFRVPYTSKDVIQVEKLFESDSSFESVSCDLEEQDHRDLVQGSNTYSDLVGKNTRQVVDMDDSLKIEDEEDDEFAPLKMQDVRFGSCPNLPSALNCCQIDYKHGDTCG